jgi:molybdate transport system substrate-binding protein
MIKRRLLSVLLPLLSAAGAIAADATPPAPVTGDQPNGDVLILAAASTTEAVTELAQKWGVAHHLAVVCSFGASATLAHQIQSGAPADLFLAADEGSMDGLDAARALKPGTRVDLLGNHLVLVAPAGAAAPAITFKKGFAFADAFTGRLAIGDPAHVPAGIYAEQALIVLHWWDGVKDRTAPAENVRAALHLVETRVCQLGVVYATDAAESTQVVTVGAFPDNTHQPIRYPLAQTVRARPAAADFCAYLASDEAAAVFTAHHFVALRGAASGTASATASATAGAPAGGH